MDTWIPNLGAFRWLWVSIVVATVTASTHRTVQARPTAAALREPQASAEAAARSESQASGEMDAKDLKRRSVYRYHCDLWTPAAETSFKGCSTPRNGVLTGMYIGLDVGPVTPSESAKRRAAIGTGIGFSFRLGVEFWDHVLLGIGVGQYWLDDRASFSESVVECTRFEGVDLGCSGPSRNIESSVTTLHFSEELGLQHRFRPWSFMSLSPGLVVGYLHAGNLDRTIDRCADCKKMMLDVEGGGAYLSPFLRITFGNMGYFAVIARPHWFLTGDLARTVYFGIEGGLP